MKDHIGNCAEHQVEQVSGNIFIRPVLLQKKNDYVDGHRHNFDHTTIFWSGTYHIKTVGPDGTTKECDIVAPDFLLIKKDTEHYITSTTPTYDDMKERLKDKSREELLENLARLGSGEARFWCVYSHRGPNGDVVQEPNNRVESYG